MPSTYLFETTLEMGGNTDHDLVSRLISASGHSLNYIGFSNQKLEVSIKEDGVSRDKLLSIITGNLPVLTLDKQRIYVDSEHSISVNVFDSRGFEARDKLLKIKWPGFIWIDRAYVVMNEIGEAVITFNKCAPGARTSDYIPVEIYYEDNSTKPIKLELMYCG